MLPDSFDVTAAPSELLVIEGRIATLSDLGIYVLQQRLVKHYTRLEVDIPALAKEAAPVLWEMHQQRDWVETVLDEAALCWPEDGIGPGTRWDDIPEDWSCPDCGAAKSDFEMVEVARP